MSNQPQLDQTDIDEWEYAAGDKLVNDDKVTQQSEGLEVIPETVYTVKRRLIDPDENIAFYYIQDTETQSKSVKSASMVHNLYTEKEDESK